MKTRLSRFRGKERFSCEIVTVMSISTNSFKNFSSFGHVFFSKFQCPVLKDLSTNLAAKKKYLPRSWLKCKFQNWSVSLHTVYCSNKARRFYMHCYSTVYPMHSRSTNVIYWTNYPRQNIKTCECGMSASKECAEYSAYVLSSFIGRHTSDIFKSFVTYLNISETSMLLQMNLQAALVILRVDRKSVV